MLYLPNFRYSVIRDHWRCCAALLLFQLQDAEGGENPLAFRVVDRPQEAIEL